MKPIPRSLIALFLAVLYTAIAVVPLASSVTGSLRQSPPVIAQCSGDCTTCGCSPEEKAAGTCCCAMRMHRHDDVQADHGGGKAPSLTCSCPCGGRDTAISDFRIPEHLPHLFVEAPPAPRQGFLSLGREARPTDRHYPPPDPPPKSDVFS